MINLTNCPHEPKQPIFQHVKNVSSQYDQLFNLCNKLEQKLNDFEKKLNSKTETFEPSEHLITMYDLEVVIQDVKESIEYVMQQTPRQNTEIEEIKKQIEELKQKIDDKPIVAETSQDFIHPKICVKEIPRLNLVKKSKKIA